MGLYRLPSISILSSQVVTTDRAVSLLDHKGCPQTLLYDTSLNSDTRGHPDVAKKQNFVYKKKRTWRAQASSGRAMEQRSTTFLSHLSQCLSILMGKVLFHMCNQFPLTPVRMASCSLMVLFLEKSDSSTNQCRSWIFSSLLIPALTFGGQYWTQGQRWGSTNDKLKGENPTSLCLTQSSL